MQPAVVAGIIAAGVVVVGWFVNYLLTAHAERRRQRLLAQLSYVDRQLEKLYGPMAFLMHEGQASFGNLMATLGRESVFSGDHELPPDELELWLFWVDNDFMPRNEAVQNLLSGYSHLIVGSELPQSYVRFIEHHSAWRVSHLRWRKQGIPYSWMSTSNWPQNFSTEVIATFGALKKEQAELIGKVNAERRKLW